jgi:hypothetical protein
MPSLRGWRVGGKGDDPREKTRSHVNASRFKEISQAKNYRSSGSEDTAGNV